MTLENIAKHLDGFMTSSLGFDEIYPSEESEWDDSESED